MCNHTYHIPAMLHKYDKRKSNLLGRFHIHCIGACWIWDVYRQFRSLPNLKRKTQLHQKVWVFFWRYELLLVCSLLIIPVRSPSWSIFMAGSIPMVLVFCLTYVISWCYGNVIYLTSRLNVQKFVKGFFELREPPCVQIRVNTRVTQHDQNP